jgi:hypothetical protein
MKYFKWCVIITQFNFPGCGVSGAFNRRQPRNLSSLEHGRIINGKESPKGAWPWQVSVLVQFCVCVCYFCAAGMGIAGIK